METPQGLEIKFMSAPPTDQEITQLGDDAKAKELPEGTIILLRVLEGNEVGRGYQINKVPVTMGRDALCDLSITDGRMSRQHAMIFYYSPDFYLKDLGSTNGSFVNDKRIKQEVIKNGDHVKVGSTTMEFIVTMGEGAAG